MMSEVHKIVSLLGQRMVNLCDVFVAQGLFNHRETSFLYCLMLLIPGAQHSAEVHFITVGTVNYNEPPISRQSAHVHNQPGVLLQCLECCLLQTPPQPPSPSKVLILVKYGNI